MLYQLKYDINCNLYYWFRAVRMKARIINHEFVRQNYNAYKYIYKMINSLNGAIYYCDIQTPASSGGKIYVFDAILWFKVKEGRVIAWNRKNGVQVYIDDITDLFSIINI